MYIERYLKTALCNKVSSVNICRRYFHSLIVDYIAAQSLMNLDNNGINALNRAKSKQCYYLSSSATKFGKSKTNDGM